MARREKMKIKYVLKIEASLVSIDFRPLVKVL